MSKLGRNEPCHCGSGRKYKKCCLSKDEEKNQIHSNINNESCTDYDEDFEVIDDEKDDYDEDEFEEIADREEYNKIKHKIRELRKKYSCKKFEEKPPDISPDEQKIVDEWWNKFENVYTKNFDVLKCIDLIKDFVINHPNLVPNLYLHEEAIFEIEGHSLKSGNYDDFIGFLKWYRDNAFRAYILSGTYYDLSLITYQLVNGGDEDITKYFSIYREYPGHDPDNLMRFVDLFRATNNQELLIELLKDIYPYVYYSPGIIGAEDFVQPVLKNTFCKYFKKDYTDHDINSLVNSIKEFADKFPAMRICMNREYWVHLLEDMYKRVPEKKELKNRKEAEDYFSHIRNHFEVFLHDTRGKQWITAEYYSVLILEYLFKQLENNKIGKKPFQLNKDRVDNYLATQFRDIIGIREIPGLAFIQSMFYFNEYLGETGLISSECRDSNESVCKDLFEIVYRICLKSNYSAKLFEKFPHC
ncbi:MAG: SEC-C domain-containing protein [Candidatus Scalindua sp.]|nr:SEC-C domain-containing protein [Candidatus Scalindua sp.]